MRNPLRQIAPALLVAVLGVALLPATAHAAEQPEPGEGNAARPSEGAPSGTSEPAPTPTTDTPAVGERPAAKAWASVVIDLSEQELVVRSSDGSVLRRWDVSTGGTRTPTPTGRYRVSSKSRHTFATANPRVTMEHMVRFNGGIGFHSIPRLDGVPLATPLGERAVSHGCVRLADENARALYRNLPIGAIVIVRP